MIDFVKKTGTTLIVLGILAMNCAAVVKAAELSAGDKAASRSWTDNRLVFDKPIPMGSNTDNDGAIHWDYRFPNNKGREIYLEYYPSADPYKSDDFILKGFTEEGKVRTYNTGKEVIRKFSGLDNNEKVVFGEGTLNFATVQDGKIIVPYKIIEGEAMKVVSSGKIILRWYEAGKFFDSFIIGD